MQRIPETENAYSLQVLKTGKPGLAAQAHNRESGTWRFPPDRRLSAATVCSVYYAQSSHFGAGGRNSQISTEASLSSLQSTVTWPQN